MLFTKEHNYFYKAIAGYNLEMVKNAAGVVGSDEFVGSCVLHWAKWFILWSFFSNKIVESSQ